MSESCFVLLRGIPSNTKAVLCLDSTGFSGFMFTPRFTNGLSNCMPDKTVPRALVLVAARSSRVQGKLDDLTCCFPLFVVYWLSRFQGVSL